MLRITEFAEGSWRTVPFESLEHRFLDICESHRAQGRALAFAFILFDRTHPYVRSALAQQHYWDALDETSGRNISVFSLDVRPASTGEVPESRSMYGSVAPSYDRISAALSKYFDGLHSVTLPCVLFFQVADGRVIDTAAATLSQMDLPTTYRELEAVIGTAAEAVAKVKDENARNAQEIFNLIAAALRDRQQMNGIVHLYHAARPIAELAIMSELLRWMLG